jgi:hypothetical protein
MHEAAARNYRGSGHRPTGGQYQTEEAGRRTLAGGILTSAAPTVGADTGFLTPFSSPFYRCAPSRSC